MLVAQGLGRVLIDLLVTHTELGQDWSSSTMLSQSAMIGQAELHAILLQSKLLRAVMQVIEQPKHFGYLGQHAFLVCLPTFLSLCTDRHGALPARQQVA